MNQRIEIQKPTPLQIAKNDYETQFDYEDPELSYQVEVIFPISLFSEEKEKVENIARYWGNIPYVSFEGIYGLEWTTDKTLIIEVDFTKSASDDYMSREVLEKLAEWITDGTPTKKDGSRKWYGINIKPLAVLADSV